MMRESEARVREWTIKVGVCGYGVADKNTPKNTERHHMIVGHPNENTRSRMLLFISEGKIRRARRRRAVLDCTIDLQNIPTYK
jgi:hypothetical protein